MATRNDRHLLQVTFDHTTEKDIIDFLEKLRKAEKHIIIAYALRSFMRENGFYDAAAYNKQADLTPTQIEQEIKVQSKPKTTKKKAAGKNVGNMFDDFQ